MNHLASTDMVSNPEKREAEHPRPDLWPEKETQICRSPSRAVDLEPPSAGNVSDKAGLGEN